MNLLCVGSTGLVGSHVLNLALKDPRISKVTVLTRRAVPQEDPKLNVQIVDFDHLPMEASWWKADAVICTLGTTIKAAGSKEAFRKVDLEYPLLVAKMARDHGTGNYVLNSATGADSHSNFFYNQVKGELEDRLSSMNFKSLTLVRPGLIGGEREEFRLGEEMAKGLMKILGPILPKSWRINQPGQIAKVILEAAIAHEKGVKIISSKDLLGPDTL